MKETSPVKRNAIDLAWLAGIWEGEGSAGLRWAKLRHEGSARRAYLYVSISQRETSMLEEVLRIVGFGKIYNANRSDKRPLYAWYCACAQARTFMTLLLPYVRSDHKRQQITSALDMDKEMRIKGAADRRKCLEDGRFTRWGRQARHHVRVAL